MLKRKAKDYTKSVGLYKILSLGGMRWNLLLIWGFFTKLFKEYFIFYKDKINFI